MNYVSNRWEGERNKDIILPLIFGIAISLIQLVTKKVSLCKQISLFRGAL
jgi:hypothetical protein